MPRTHRFARYHTAGWFISFCQIAAARSCRAYLRLFGELHVENSVNFNNKDLYLFVANHQSQADPFTIFASLKLEDNLRIAPVRFLTAKTVYFTPLLPLLKSMGCYPTRGSREKIIDASIGYLKRGYNLCIFPEGKRTLEIDSDPRPGVSDLVRKTSSEVKIKMILVHIEWKWLPRARRCATVKLAEAPLELYTKDAESIMKAVYAV